jgi:hypothetical protein
MLAFRSGRAVIVMSLTGRVLERIVAPGRAAPRWSGDGRLLSIGGRIVGRVRLPAADLAWAPGGDTAAYVTRGGGVRSWSPAEARTIVADGWGAQAVAWSDGASPALAIGRAVCRGACGRPTHKEVWVWRDNRLQRIVGPLAGDQTPLPFTWAGGRVLWWDWPDSGSIAADGVAVYANDTRLANALMYRDYVSGCASGVAIAAGGDRYAMDGKRIVLNGRDVSRDRSRSWVSPSCRGDVLVAAASVNTVPPRIGREHRAIWQLLPARRQLTHPPAGYTDEYPRVLPGGSLLFVRTRAVSTTLELYGVGTVELLRDGRLTALGAAGKADNYYGHYDWPDVVAVSG